MRWLRNDCVAESGAPAGSNHRTDATPAKSAAQQKAAGAALSAKRGKTPKGKLKEASKSMMSMSLKELEAFAHTQPKAKPEHVGDK